MKYLILSLCLVSTITIAKTPQQILKEEGFVFVTKEANKEIYYRPKEVKHYDGFAYYSTTQFFINSKQKYSLESDYVALDCNEKMIIKLGIHKVPYFGKSSYTDLTKKGIKATDVKPLSKLDTIMYRKVCRR